MFSCGSVAAHNFLGSSAVSVVELLVLPFCVYSAEAGMEGIVGSFELADMTFKKLWEDAMLVASCQCGEETWQNWQCLRESKGSDIVTLAGSR